MENYQDATHIYNDSNTRSTEESVVGPQNNEFVMDYTSLFATGAFESRDELVQWVRNRGKELGMVITVKRSDSGEAGKRPRLVLACERSGKHRGKGLDSTKLTGTKKCECPFELRGKQISLGEQWTLHVTNGMHNHPCARYMEGHSYAGRLTAVEEELVVDMSKSNSRPKDILYTLKERYPQNTSTMKTLYNARQKHRIAEHAGRSQLQYLMGKLQEHGYFFYHRRCENSDTVKDLFYAHPTSVQLLRAFPNVLLMDCTYKTNRYKLPLLEIVGVTSTDMTFSIACVYLEHEREDNYTWALSILRSLIDQSSLPSVIITDRELALMNAVERIFPTARHFLCRWHISRKILTNCRKSFQRKEIWDCFMSSWTLLVLAQFEGLFYELLKKFEEDYSCYDGVVAYVMKQWIDPYKERFVSCWTNQVMHFDNNTTNRAESAHAKLKKHLGSSQGNLETCWTKIHSLLETSHTAIKHSFEKSTHIVQHRYKPTVFKLLRGAVSTTALDKIFDEMKNINNVGVDPLLCGCVLRKTCGLPCAHEIAEYIRMDLPIPFHIIDSFWKKLDMEPCTVADDTGRDELKTRLNRAFTDVSTLFSVANETEQMLMLKRLTEIANPATTSLLEPNINPNTRGRPPKGKSRRDKSTKRDPSGFEYVENIIDSCSPPLSGTGRQKQKVIRRHTRVASNIGYIDQLPSHFREYITRTEDVLADGHCGFRATAGLLGLGEDAWFQVRQELLEELVNYPDLYAGVFMEHGRVQKQMQRLTYFEESAPKSHWMSLPETGYLIASRYNVALITLSAQMSCTYLPLRTCIVDTPKCICIGFVNKNHFIQVFLREGHPVPPITHQWYGWHRQCASDWAVFYGQQVELYTRIIGTSSVTDSIEEIDPKE